jgi:F-type H+-transporting ATPase subunit epsilon
MSKEDIKLKIITMDGVFFSDSVSEIILPTDIGQITVLPMHIPLISKIKEGVVLLRTSKGEKKIKVSSGVLEVRPHSEVYLLVDRAE